MGEWIKVRLGGRKIEQAVWLAIRDNISIEEAITELNLDWICDEDYQKIIDRYNEVREKKID